MDRAIARGMWIALICATLAIPQVAPALSESPGHLPPGGTFVDDDGSVHEGAIEAIAAAGVTAGCDAERYCPDRLVTRAEMAAFLRRALDLPSSTTNWFTDDAPSGFEDDINAIAEMGITTGCGGGRFCPTDTMSRAQMAAFLDRAFDLAASPVDVFADDAGNIHEPSINAVATAGITMGCAERSFCPMVRVSRAQMASFLARALGLDEIVPPPREPQLCRTEPSTAPTGTFDVAAGGHSPAPGAGTVVRYMVEVEDGLGVDIDCFAASVEMVLGDGEGGWGADGTRSFQRVDSGVVAFRVTLASPATVDAHCLPLRTGGIYSCWNGSRAMINAWRWEFGADAYAGETGRYRIYLINHEVGHALGNGHVSCPGAGLPAPVMMQQSKGIGSCAPNPWPVPST